MPQISYGWKWEADKPSQIHCGQCGFHLTITPNATELKDGFIWYCIKCGARFHYGNPKPVEQKSVELEPVKLKLNNLEQPLGLGYPQTNRLFERKKISEWLSLMIGNVLHHDSTANIATKFKSYYRRKFGKNPIKVNNCNSYSGIELNICLAYMSANDRSLANTLQSFYLEKIRKEITVGSIVVSDRGAAREVIEIIGDAIVLDIEGQHRQVDRSTVMSIVHSSENGF